jgi:hypothetical protein
VWDTFKTDEIDGVLYGYAEGELYQKYSRTKDLWHDIYDLGKQFAASYGGHWIDYHLFMDEGTEDLVLRVFDEVVFDEISLTTRPANPDTALEVLNKYAVKLESLVRDDITYEDIESMNTKKNLRETEQLKKSVEPVEEATNSEETTVETVVEPKGEEATAIEVEDTEIVEIPNENTKEASEIASEIVPEEIKEELKDEKIEDKVDEGNEEQELAVESDADITKSTHDVVKAMQEMAKTIQALTKEVETLKKQPSERKSIAAFKDDEVVKSLSTEDKAEDELQEALDEIQKKYPFARLLLK